MKLHIQNIGLIGNAEIELDGITIIAGINNKGKSTVGKTVFALLHDMDKWESMYKEIRFKKIYDFLTDQSTVLEDICMELSGAKRRRTGKANQLARKYSGDEDFFAAIEDMQVQEGDSDLFRYLQRYASEYLELYYKKDQHSMGQEYEEKVESWIQAAARKAAEIDLDELNLQSVVLQASFTRVFGDQYRKIGTDESRIQLTVDERTVAITIKNDWNANLPLRMRSKVHFLESPRIYDLLSDTKYGHVQREYLQYLLRPNVAFEKPPFRMPSDISETAYSGEVQDADKKLSDILQNLINAMNGRAVFLQKIGLEFRNRRFTRTIHASNVSTGVKALALLEYALRIGAIRENDILILDEPEINLHPQWQVLYAGALVNLLKHFGIRILLTTHSPYFLRAIECYTDVEGQMDRLNVYRAEDSADGSSVTFENLSYSEYGLTSLYEDLSAPLAMLEELLEGKRYKIYRRSYYAEYLFW